MKKELLVLIIGEQGTGKTTLGKLIKGAFKPPKGVRLVIKEAYPACENNC